MAWITSADVAEMLGTATIDPFMDQCAAAADAFAQRRRAQAGYIDDPDIAPGPDATLGTTVYAVALFRERGSVDSFASFEDFSTGIVPQSSFGQVLRLLGVPRPAVA